MWMLQQWTPAHTHTHTELVNASWDWKVRGNAWRSSSCWVFAALPSEKSEKLEPRRRLKARKTRKPTESGGRVERVKIHTWSGYRTNSSIYVHGSINKQIIAHTNRLCDVEESADGNSLSSHKLIRVDFTVVFIISLCTLAKNMSSFRIHN